MNITKQNHIALFVILFFSLILRLPLINGSLWLDEAAQALESLRPLGQQLNIAKDFQPPLIHLILHFAQKISTAEWWMRSITSLIPGVLTVWLTYMIGKGVNKKVGLLAALLLATSSLHIFYSQELRPYSLPAFFAVLSFYLFLKLLRGENKGCRTRYGLVAANALGLYSSYLFPFVLISQFLYIIIFRRKQLMQRFLDFFTSSAIFAPWLPFFFQQLKVGQSWRVELPGWDQVVSLPQLKALPLTVAKFFYGIVNIDVSLYFVVSSLIFALLIIFAIRTFFKHSTFPPSPRLRRASNIKLSKNNDFLLVSVFWLLSLLLIWLISFIVPVLRPKRVLFLLPSFYLLLSFLVFQLKEKTLQKLFIAFLLLVNSYGVVSYWSKPELQREDWRGLITEIEEKFEPNEVIILQSFDEAFAPWRFYSDNGPALPAGRYKILDTGSLYIENSKKLKYIAAEITNYEYVLVFDYLRDLTDPENTLIKLVENQGYKEIGAIDAGNIGFVRILKKDRMQYASRY